MATAVKAGRWRRYVVAVSLWAIGLGLIVVLIRQQDNADLLDALSVAGWWLPVFLRAMQAQFFWTALVGARSSFMQNP